MSAVARAIAQVATKLFGTARSRHGNKRLREEARTLVPVGVAEGLLGELNEGEISRLDVYLASPDFEEIALQFVLGRLLKDVPWEELAVNIRHELRYGLRSSAGLRTGLLTTATDVVFSALAASSENVAVPDGHRLSPGVIAVSAHLTAAAAANSRLLSEVSSLADFHTFAEQLRAQVVAVHGHMRLPHVGVSRSVPYEQLYVEPLLRQHQEQREVPDMVTVALPGRRSVILGDPGAGKSTLAAKLAHDVAFDLVVGAEGRVPFLLVLRDFAGSFRTGGKGLVHYLEQVCGDPYNLEPPPNAVDYLLRNGRAMVLLDGLDELVEPALRGRFVQLVEGFVSRYPLVPVLVTARPIGYTDAPLDRRIFSVGVIAELERAQVRRYAERWFALDESTAEGERARTAQAFLVESESVAELRANPLMLSLLCVVYSGEHHIPRNPVLVYERCALMLFDSWDSVRGIAMPVRFHGRLRGVVQFLAWQMFVAEESGKALPRHRIVRMLADYFTAKNFDDDEAIATAEQFVALCTGRTWILTDLGATDTEQRYGFTHRTFMEYFAAEYIVRAHPTARSLWEALGPHVRFGEWEVVAQTALQLLDRNADGGLDEFLRLVLTDKPDGLDQRLRLHSFAARTLRHLHPHPNVIRDVVAVIVNAALELDIRDHRRYWCWPWDNTNVTRRYDALLTVMYRCSPRNLPVVRQTLVKILDGKIESGVEAALYAVLSIFEGHAPGDEQTLRIWKETRQDIQDRHTDALTAWSERAPWRGLSNWGDIVRTVARFGPWPLYLRQIFVAGSRACVAEELMAMGINCTPLPLDEEKLCNVLVRADRPWISDKRWWSELREIPLEFQQMTMIAEDSYMAPPTSVVLLFMPYLEGYAHANFSAPLPETAPILLKLLIAARAQGANDIDLEASLQRHGFSEESRSFLVSWVHREFDVLVLPPH